MIFCASRELQADNDVVLAAIAQNGDALFFASENLQANKEVVLAAIAQSSGALAYASDGLKADKDFVLAAVAQHGGGALERASEMLKADKDVIAAAVAQDGGALQHASVSLQEMRAYVFALVFSHRSYVFFLFGRRESPPSFPRCRETRSSRSYLPAHGPR